MASEDHMASREPSPAGGVKPSREAELQALLSRVEAGDDSPDALIWLVTTALIPANGRLPQEDADAAARRRVAKMLDADAALDAALALAERVLPSAICGVEGIGSPEPDARVITESDGYEVVVQFEAAAKTPALALIAALLKALAAEAASPESGSTGVWPNQSPTPLSKTEVQS